MPTLRQRATEKIRAWSFKRHGQDTLPIVINRRRVYILPTRLGFVLGGGLVAMLLASLNYNSNLGLAFAFLLASQTLVIMHHCNRNLLRLSLDATTEVDAFAGGKAVLEFVLRNASKVERRDVEVRLGEAASFALYSFNIRTPDSRNCDTPDSRNSRCLRLRRRSGRRCQRRPRRRREANALAKVLRSQLPERRPAR